MIVPRLFLGSEVEGEQYLGGAAHGGREGDALERAGGGSPYASWVVTSATSPLGFTLTPTPTPYARGAPPSKHARNFRRSAVITTSVSEGYVGAGVGISEMHGAEVQCSIGIGGCTSGAMSISTSARRSFGAAGEGVDAAVGAARGATAGVGARAPHASMASGAR